MSEGSGHQGLWTEPRYPGDAVRMQLLYRKDVIGDIRIQHYGEKVLVASFLPGIDVFNPGDTPKTEPEQSEWCDNNFQADAVFDRYVQEAYAEFWQNYDPDAHLVLDQQGYIR